MYTWSQTSTQPSYAQLGEEKCSGLQQKLKIANFHSATPKWGMNRISTEGGYDRNGFIAAGNFNHVKISEQSAQQIFVIKNLPPEPNPPRYQ